MKRLKCRANEGWLLAAMLGIALLICLLVWGSRLPRSVIVEPVSFVSLQDLATPAPAPLDINSADVQQLAGLPGIGETIARRIVEYRQENGPFSRVEDLDGVEGIGEGRIAGLAGLVFCG